MVISIASDFPAGSGTTRVCLSTSFATPDSASADARGRSTHADYTGGICGVWRSRCWCGRQPFARRHSRCRRSRSRLPAATSSSARKSTPRSRRRTRASSTTPATSSRPSATCGWRVAAEVRANDHVQLLDRGAARSGPRARSVRLVRARAAVAGAALRHPGRTHPANVRRHDAHRVRQRQPADRAAAGVSVPVVVALGRVAGDERRSVAHARTRLAVEFSRRQQRRRARIADGQYQPLGYRRAGARRQRQVRMDRFGDGGLAVGPALPRQQRRPSPRRPPGRPADAGVGLRRLRLARRVGEPHRRCGDRRHQFGRSIAPDRVRRRC